MTIRRAVLCCSAQPLRVNIGYVAHLPRSTAGIDEAIKAIEAAGGEVIAAAALVDRSAGAVDLGVPFFPLLRLDVPTYAPDALPPELAAIPAIKPGSRAA